MARSFAALSQALAKAPEDFHEYIPPRPGLPGAPDPSTESIRGWVTAVKDQAERSADGMVHFAEVAIDARDPRGARWALDQIGIYKAILEA